MAILAKCVDKTFVHAKHGAVYAPYLVIELCDIQQHKIEPLCIQKIGRCADAPFLKAYNFPCVVK